MNPGNGCFFPLVSWLFLSVAEGGIQSVANIGKNVVTIHKENT